MTLENLHEKKIVRKTISSHTREWMYVRDIGKKSSNFHHQLSKLKPIIKIVYKNCRTRHKKSRGSLLVWTITCRASHGWLMQINFVLIPKIIQIIMALIMIIFYTCTYCFFSLSLSENKRSHGKNCVSI
jgi:hypothetical protein